MKNKLLCCLAAVFLLSGCGQEEALPPPVEVPPLHELSLSTNWDGHEFSNISPVSAFEATDAGLKIFPYFNSENYILIERILLSDNGFWNSVISSYKDTPNCVATSNYSLFTTEAGVSLGCVQISDDECYIVRTDNLSSAYIQKVCEMLCQ